MALCVSIQGFKATYCPILCVEGSFLKHKRRGYMVAITLDANDQLYPVAFKVVDSENNNT